MGRFRLDSIAALSRQLEFTPAAKLAVQIDAAEGLLHELVASRGYPLDFVIFRITGYRPRKVAPELLTGIALQHDLGLLIERASMKLRLDTASCAEPVLSIDDVAEQFNVTSKTIQRWRRRGLPARRFVFPDAKLRVGFLLSSVERFIHAHHEHVELGANLSRIDESEHTRILRNADRLARIGCTVKELTRRIARKLSRSPLAILHTIRQHDELNPKQPILSLASSEIPEAEWGRIARAHRRGESLGCIAKRFSLTRAAIYRAVMDARIEKLAKRKAKFIDDELFHAADAARLIEDIAKQPLLAARAGGEELRVPRDLPACLAELYRTPLLTPQRERALFLKLNFQKYRFSQARRRFEPEFASSRQLDKLEQLWRRVVATRNEIIAANLRLVVSVARQHARPGILLTELLSDGNITLMRAVDGFDASRGFRFSTYATLSLQRGFARSVPLMHSGKTLIAGKRRSTDAGELVDTRRVAVPDRLARKDELGRLVKILDDQEKSVVLSRWGIGRDASGYEELARALGLTEHAVRSIEQTALTKLRVAASRRD